MKKTFLVLATALVSASSAFALVGGPWDGNIAGNPTPVDPSNVNGTYQGTIRGKNIAGIMMFGTGSTSSSSNTTTYNQTYNSTTSSWSGSYTFAEDATGLGTSNSEGRCLIFVNGYSIYGQMTTVIDAVSRKIAGVLEGSKTKTTENFTLRNVESYNIIDPVINGTTGQVTTPGRQEYVYSNTAYQFNDIMTVNGTFSAKMSDVMSMPTFSGKGTVEVQEPTAQGYTVNTVGDSFSSEFQRSVTVEMAAPVFYNIKVKGVKSSTETPSFGAAVTISYPSVVIAQ